MSVPLVVDTDVVSVAFKARAGYETYLEEMAGRECILSFMSLAELFRWPLARKWAAARRRELEEYVDGLFAISYCNEDLCKIWAEVVDVAEQNGKPIHVADAWIAATALYHEAPLLTLNTRHYEGVPNLGLIGG
jgi:predicted nucleic acid-binding protein